MPRFTFYPLHGGGKKKAEAIIKKNIEASDAPPVSGNYMITLMVHQYAEDDQLIGAEVGTIETHHSREVENAAGEMVEEKYIETKPAMWGAASYMEAQGIADRKLVAREDSVYCEIENQIGDKVITRIFRSDAFARVFRKQKQAICRVKGKSTKTLKMGMRCKNDRSIGPWSMHR